MTHSQRAARSPLVRSPVASTWRSSLGLLARVAASKRGRSPSTRIASSPLEERANSSARSPSILGSPSPMTTPFGGSKINHPHGELASFFSFTITLVCSYNIKMFL